MLTNLKRLLPFPFAATVLLTGVLAAPAAADVEHMTCKIERVPTSRYFSGIGEGSLINQTFSFSGEITCDSTGLSPERHSIGQVSGWTNAYLTHAVVHADISFPTGSAGGPLAGWSMLWYQGLDGAGTGSYAGQCGCLQVTDQPSGQAWHPDPAQIGTVVQIGPSIPPGSNSTEFSAVIDATFLR
jgi:hypothetical protein